MEQDVVTQAVAAIQGLQADIGTVSAAIILCAAAVMLGRWIKAQFF